MDGDIRLTFEREPDYFRSAVIEGDRHSAFVARDEARQVRGVCSRAVRPVWFNGGPARIGYLGQLRCEVPLRGSLRPLVDGFAACASTRLADELPFDLTSIMADNHRARRLLESGLHGLPEYRRLTNFRTLLLPKRQRPGRADAAIRIEAGSRGAAPAIASFLQSQYQRFQFAPVWTASDLLSDQATRDLGIEDFMTAWKGDRIVGCAALWDQSRFKQTVVRGYAERLGRVRHLANLWMRLTGSPRLPPVGSPVRTGAISHFAVEDDEPRIALALLGAIFGAAATRPFDYLVVGFAEGHRLARVVEDSLSARILSSILYTVHYPGSDAVELDGRTPHVEVATL